MYKILKTYCTWTEDSFQFLWTSSGKQTKMFVALEWNPGRDMNPCWLVHLFFSGTSKTTQCCKKAWRNWALASCCLMIVEAISSQHITILITPTLTSRISTADWISLVSCMSRASFNHVVSQRWVTNPGANLGLGRLGSCLGQ